MECENRLQWVGKLEFLFTSVGYTVGLGNIWRFPERCYKNGGGAFLLPYLMTVLFCTFPMLFLEMFLGQFASEGPIAVWKFCPLFKGVGWGIIFITFTTNIYYIVLVAYSLFYMLLSFVHIGGPLPWQECREEDAWSTDKCRTDPYPNFLDMTENDKVRTSINMMGTECLEKEKIKRNISDILALPFKYIQDEFSSCRIKYRSPEQEYWNRFVLGVHESGGLDDIGSVVGRNAVTLFIVWLVVFYCCLRGIRSIAKVAYVTATFPVALLLILLVRGTTLPGYDRGIQYYTKPDWSKLSDMSIWASAATQAMYSMGIVYGAHITLASYNKFNNNITRDTIILGLVNTVTSIFGGFIVFSFLGHASYQLNKPIEDIFDQGPGILFISYIQGVSQLPGSAVWALLFFMMVFTLGLDSVFLMVWTVYRALVDVMPRKFQRRERFTLMVMCLISFLLGLPLVTNGGIHMLVLMDRYLADYALTIFLIIEAMSICWLYGLNNFLSDIEMMIGKRSRAFDWYLRITWSVTSPAFCLFIFIASAIGYTKPAYDGTEIPAFGEAIGWLIILTPIVIIVGFGVFEVLRYGTPTKHTLLQNIKWSIEPAKDWGPRLPENRTGKYSSDDYITPTHIVTNEQQDINMNGYTTTDI
ncbi:sodium-dependent proline transporter-like [Mercenaria mercenaria]|uniref:sodium-dependent proline transporter-like n=1 Tax=Mercenaria mercenaria TaxID=6596 RepID=UPI00234FA189|nr:sodium-dependent proline transporter-like [Mercenaria mercenaria]